MMRTLPAIVGPDDVDGAPEAGEGDLVALALVQGDQPAATRTRP